MATRRAPSALAVNYLLALEDQLTPALAVAEKGYTRFTKSIEKLNARTEKSITRTFDKLAGLVREFSGGASSGKSIGGSKALPRGGGKGLADAVAKGVAAALKGVQFRLHATTPAKKNSKFNTSVNLSRLYKGMPQPPDLVGMMDGLGARKYAKGGLVTGTGGKDKVPALLTAGEWVLTKDQVKDIVKAAGALRNAKGGGFASGAGLSKVLTEMKVLTSQAEKLKVAAELGLDPRAASDYARVVERLALSESKLTRETSKLALANKVMLAPELSKVREEVKGITSSAPKASTAFNKLIKSIATSAGFVAIHTAVKTVQEDFLELRAATEHAVGEFGIDTAADGLVTNFNQMNRTLGLSRDALADLRNEFVDTVKQLPLGTRRFDMASEAMQHLVEIGAGPKIARELTPAISAFGQATGIASDATAELAYRMTKQLNMGVVATGDSMAYIAKVGAAMQVSVQGVTEALTDAYEANQSFFKSMAPDQAQMATQTLTRVAAVGESIAGGFGKSLSKLLADTAAGNSDALAKAGVLGIGSVEDARKALQSGDLQGMFGKLQGMDPLAMKALADSIGATSDDIANMTFNTEDLGKRLAATKGIAIEAGKGLGYLGERALANQSAFEHIRNVIGDLITGTFPNVIAFFKDLNPLVLISWIYLGAKLLPVLRAISKWAGMIIPVLPWLIAKVFALGLAMKSWAFGSVAMNAALGVPIKTLGIFSKAWNVLRVGLMWGVRALAAVTGGTVALVAAVAAAVAAVGYLGYVIYKHWSAMPGIISEALSEAGAAITTALTFYGRKFTELFSSIGDGVSWVADQFTGLPSALWGALTEMGTMVARFFTGLPAVLGNAIETLANWLVAKLSHAIPDWVFTALNYAGVISDDELSTIKSQRSGVAVAPSAIAPAQQHVFNRGADNADLLDAIGETNKHLADISGNTEDGIKVNVTSAAPRSTHAFSNQLAAGL